MDRALVTLWRGADLATLSADNIRLGQRLRELRAAGNYDEAVVTATLFEIPAGAGERLAPEVPSCAPGASGGTEMAGFGL